MRSILTALLLTLAAVPAVAKEPPQRPREPPKRPPILEPKYPRDLDRVRPYTCPACGVRSGTGCCVIPRCKCEREPRSGRPDRTDV